MKRIGLLCLMTTLMLGAAYGQKFDANKLQATLHKAIVAAYPASVRMWGFDTVAKQQMSAQFSGVVVTKAGHILTAAHTTIPGKTYKVMFPDGKECIAMALGKIEFSENKTRPDVAMMKIITPGTYPYAVMGSSATLKQNEPCLSIAYPESLYQPMPMVRFGYVSNIKNDFGFVQSTCTMEPGDSGGPLFDYNGRVIALHSAIDVPEDINYEIPVDLYKTYWSALNKPQVYTSLPAVTDAVESKSSAEDVMVFDTKNINIRFKADGDKFKSSCIVIASNLKGQQGKVMGTLFSLKGSALNEQAPNNVVVSKSSLVGDEPVIIWGGKRVKAAIITRNRENDIIVLEPAVSISGGLPFKSISPDTLGFAQLGNFLISPLPDTSSVISVAGSLPFKLPRVYSLGYLGAAIAYKEGPLLLTVVQPASPAGLAGFKVGDEVVSINNVAMKKPADYGGQLQQYWPGDTISFQLKRADSSYTKNVVLAPRPPMAVNHPAELFAGGKSSRRDGFDKVFAHDARLKPWQCGGPVYDSSGHFYGINIARYSRTATLAIPATVVKQVITEALQRKYLSYLNE